MRLLALLLILILPISSLAAQWKGSGVLVNQNGYIVTAQHVTQGAKYLIVKYNNQWYKARIIVENPATDTAVIKIEARDTNYVALSSTSTRLPGTVVSSWGYPFMAVNLVVTYGRWLHDIPALDMYAYKFHAGEELIGCDNPDIRIVTNAESHPGNSGGAIMDLNQNMIGMLVCGDDEGIYIYNLSIKVETIRSLLLKHDIQFVTSDEAHNVSANADTPVVLIRGTDEKSFRK